MICHCQAYHYTLCVIARSVFCDEAICAYTIAQIASSAAASSQ